MRILRKGAVAATAVALALTATACGAGDNGAATGGATGDSVEITWWHNATGEPMNSFWREVAADFEDANPGVTVNVQAFQNEELGVTLIPNSFAGGTSPDLFQAWAGGILADWVDGGHVLNLSEAAPELVERMGSISASWTFDGSTFALPYTFGASGFWYNRDLFEQAGITETPTTLDEFNTVVQKLKDAGITPIGLGGGDGWPAAHYWFQFVMKTVPIEALEAGLERNDFSDPSWVEATDKLRAFIETEPFQNGWQTASAQQGAGSSAGLMATGQVAMELMGHWAAGSYGGILAEQTGDTTGEPPAFLGWFPFPSIPGTGGDPTAILGGGDAFSVGSNAPAETLDLLEFILSVDVQTRYAELGNLPTVAGAESALTFQPMIDNFNALQAADHVQLWIDLAMPSHAAVTAMNNAIPMFMRGEGTAQDLVDAIAQAAE